MNDGTLNLVDDVKYWYIDDPQGANTSKYLVHKNDILVNFINSEAKMGTATIVDAEPDRDTIYTTNIMKLKVNSQNDPYFVFNQTFCQKYKNYVKSITKPAVNQASFTTVDFKKFDFSVPVKEEQQKIGAFFKQHDHLITFHQRKLSHLQTRKKGLLQKMFPKDGELFPELRFPGFTVAWKEQKISDVADVFDGTHQTPNYTSSGIMFLSVENIKTLKSKKYISKDAFESEFKFRPEKGDVLMTRIGDIGTANVLRNEEPVAYYVSLALFKPTKIESDFLAISIATPFVQDGLWKRTLHIAFPKKINKNEIANVEINIPCLEEQAKIGAFFKQLDDSITLHQRKLDHLQERKKALLQQMFV